MVGSQLKVGLIVVWECPDWSWDCVALSQLCFCLFVTVPPSIGALWIYPKSLWEDWVVPTQGWCPFLGMGQGLLLGLVSSVGTKCYLSRQHGAGPKVVQGSRLQVNCGNRSIVVDRLNRKGCCVLGAWSEGEANIAYEVLRDTDVTRLNTTTTHNYTQHKTDCTAQHTQRWNQKR